MKQFVIVLLASLTGMLIALLAYDRLIVAPREAARERQRATQQQAQGVSLARADEQAQRIAHTLDASVDRSVDDARRSMEKLAAEQGRRGMAAQALASASMVKVQLAEYYMTEGRWPKNGAEAGIASAAEYGGGGVSGIDVGDEGRIVVRLNDRVAANARIRLTPQVSEATGMIQWHCELQGAPDIAAQLPACRD
jgi:hypothetical protein